MNINPDEVYSKYGRDIGRLQKLAVQKAARLGLLLNSKNQQKLDDHNIDIHLLRELKAKKITTFADLAYMCERKGRIKVPRDDIARLIGFFDEFTEKNKEAIREYNDNQKKCVDDEEAQRNIKTENVEKKYDNDTSLLLCRLMQLWSHFGCESGFYHYTHFDNFLRIMKEGKLCSRKRLEEDGCNFYDTASEDALGRTENLPLENVRFFYAPKPPFLYVTEGIKAEHTIEHMPTPVLLLFDEKIVYNEGVFYLDMSGSHMSKTVMYESQFTTNPAEALDYNWPVIFSRGPLPKPYNNVVAVCGISDAGIIKAHRNAELLYPNCIETKYIKKIYFRSVASMKMANLSWTG